MPPVTHYELLGVPTEADAAAIKRAWRERVSQHHPDHAKGGRDETTRTRATAELNAAYAVLGDPQKRAAYDLALAQLTAPPAAAPRRTPTPTAATTTAPATPPRAKRSQPNASAAQKTARVERAGGLLDWLLRSSAGQWASLGLLLCGCLASLPFGNSLGEALGTFASLAFYLLAAQSLIVRRLQGPSAAVLAGLGLFFGLLFGIGRSSKGSGR